MCVYLVQSSIFIVLLGEARGHHTPLVTLEKATSFNYFWQQGGGRVLQLHTHFKDTYNPSIPCSHPPPPAPNSYIYFSGTATAFCQAEGNFPAEMDLPEVSSGATAL